MRVLMSTEDSNKSYSAGLEIETLPKAGTWEIMAAPEKCV